jgi:hypothetical protein
LASADMRASASATSPPGVKKRVTSSHVSMKANALTLLNCSRRA